MRIARFPRTEAMRVPEIGVLHHLHPELALLITLPWQAPV